MTDQTELRVVVASQRTLLVDAIELALRRRTALVSFAQVNSDGELGALPVESAPTAVLVDLDHPCVTPAGLDQLRSMTRPRRTIGFYDLFTSQHASRAFELGLTALMPTSAAEQAFSDAVTGDALMGGVDPVGVTSVSGVGNEDRRRLASLTPRELEVLVHIAGGDQRQETAARLGIAVGTVDSHRRHILRKLGVESQSMAVALAQRAGYLDAT